MVRYKLWHQTWIDHVVAQINSESQISHIGHARIKSKETSIDCEIKEILYPAKIAHRQVKHVDATYKHRKCGTHGCDPDDKKDFCPNIPISQHPLRIEISAHR